jgi:hypothetical protein
MTSANAPGPALPLSRQERWRQAEETADRHGLTFPPENREALIRAASCAPLIVFARRTMARR